LLSKRAPPPRAQEQELDQSIFPSQFHQAKMNLAEATTALTQKDSEKATLVAEIEKIKVCIS
jgi:hypothetical protein